MSALQMFEIAVKLLTPLVLLGMISFFWASKSGAPRLARFLRWNSIFWTILLATLCGVLFIMSATCSGHIEYGYHSCPFLPDPVSSFYGEYLTLAWSLAIAISVMSFFIGAVIEYHVHSKHPSPPSSTTLEK